MTISKTAQMLDLLNSGDTKGALRIAKTFRLGLTQEQKKVLVLGAECITFPYIYRQLGKDTDDCIQKAVNLLYSIYANRL